ncbi:MAG: hypothetical protein U5S82_00980 [Gammaproteobacteria bacterium]|nr:hypothetical protein [Gammaproteobacteria bacterium]
MPHLVVDISSHGFGHLAQVAPAVEALRARRPDLQLTVRCALPEAVVRTRIPHLERLIPLQADVGMVMASAMTVRVDDSHSAHLAFHRHWPRRVDDAAEDLAALAPDLLLADVPYLSLAAAEAAGVPTVALCSLNWADVYRAYCGHLPGAERVLEEMTTAYGAVSLFIQATPHMPMAWIPRHLAVAPIAPPPAGDRREVRERLGVDAGTRLLLVALGGIDTRLEVDRWPAVSHGLWMVPEAWAMAAPHIRPLPSGVATFPELLAAADMVLTKPGYGTFVEAACAGTPVLYIDRPDWPETPYLAPWLASHVACAAVDGNAVVDGTLIPRVHDLLAAGRCPAHPFTGAVDAAAKLDLMLEIKC